MPELIPILKNLIANKKVLVLGYGREGKSSYNLLTAIGGYESLTAADKNPGAFIGFSGSFIAGDAHADNLDSYDVVIKSPGVVLPKDASAYEAVITSQTELFLEAYRDQIIGITGTKGKSTVSSLCFHILSASGKRCLLAGNIGVPVFDIYDKIDSETDIVLELSCHQLENCKLSPHIALFINLYEDHIDHYGTFEKYKRAKQNIYLHQSGSDILLAGTRVPTENAISCVRIIDSGILPFEKLEDYPEIKLRGEHNLTNCAFAYALAGLFGIPDDIFIISLESFTPLRHRLEYVGSVNGADFYDDSISTTVESAISAMKSIPNAETILLGGMDRGINYTHLVDFLLTGAVKNIILMYDSGKRIYDDLISRPEHSSLHIKYCGDLESAAAYAVKVTGKGKACILSPAAASYGDFKNFEERGDRFGELITLSEL